MSKYSWKKRSKIQHAKSRKGLGNRGPHMRQRRPPVKPHTQQRRLVEPHMQQRRLVKLPKPGSESRDLSHLPSLPAKENSVFISHRRSDSADHAAQIRKIINKTLGKNAAFTDVGSVPPGHDYRKVIRNGLRQSDVVLVLIGPKFLNSLNKKRLHERKDWVAFEAKHGLKNKNKLVIPVLLEGAEMPSKNRLPPSIQELVYRNAVKVRPDHYLEDIQPVLNAIQSHRYRQYPMSYENESRNRNRGSAPTTKYPLPNTAL